MILPHRLKIAYFRSIKKGKISLQSTCGVYGKKPEYPVDCTDEWQVGEGGSTHIKTFSLEEPRSELRGSSLE